MPNRLQKAIGVFKDQTSISLAKVNSSSNMQVLVLKATTHDDFPMDERYVSEILNLIASNKSYASACARAICRRITRTRNWVVALKSLILVLRIFQDGDLYFPREVLHVTKKGGRLLNLSDFEDYSSSTPGDYTAFVRTFALYLNERLDCFLTGKVQKRHGYTGREGSDNYRKRTNNYVYDMKPTMLLDRIIYWQRLLEQAIVTRPAGVAKDNQFVKLTVHVVVRETFDLYRDISDGLAFLFDNFLQLKDQSRESFLDISAKAEKQFEELDEFYSMCKAIGVGKTLEYPTIKFVSGKLIGTMQESLKDQTDSMASREALVIPEVGLSSIASFSLSTETGSDKRYESGSECISSDELTITTKTGTSPSISIRLEVMANESERMGLPVTNSVVDLSFLDDRPANDEQNENQEQDLIESVLENQLSQSSLVNKDLPECSLGKEREFNLIDGVTKLSQAQGFNAIYMHEKSGSNDNWEPVLAQIPNNQQSTNHSDTFTPVTLHNYEPQHHYNPFLQDLYDIPVFNSCVASYWAQNQTDTTNKSFTTQTLTLPYAQDMTDGYTTTHVMVA